MKRSMLFSSFLASEPYTETLSVILPVLGSGLFFSGLVLVALFTCPPV
ncbi:hypothetical protein F981_01857 [Acinetobacter guillouiae CIP 63.46]|nr:hypothetical protein F981_01857 [Acinetobacter guillouiae CIP 63.46]